MTDVIVDASVAAPFLIADEAGDRSDQLLAVLTDGRAIVPQHWRLEVANLGWKAVRQKRITRAELQEAMALLATLPVRVDRGTDEFAWTRILDIALDQDLTSYDAAYVELAKRNGLPLATIDKALVRVAPKVGVVLFRL
ncbi:MAG TPA: type II toxin-antitoxin system VapC family toxin [Sphingomicrobium sp.]|jgi:predicted nucleic acid-binding protein|nr:type II toxin-antitoxin system VapC family toxin [Sphingomicrobium sp.]